MTADIERALLERISLDPENPASYDVYGDWLLAQGDPRGEMFALQHAASERPGDHRLTDAARAHLEANAELYLGDLAHFVLDPRWAPYLRLGWRGGFIAQAELHAWYDDPTRPADVLAELLALPAARFLTDLDAEADGCADAIAARPLPALRTLWLGPRDFNSHPGTLGPLHAIWPSVAALRELVVHGEPETLGGIELPALRRATFRMPPRRGAGHMPIATARWPQLESLQLWYPDEREAITALLLGRDDLVTLGELAFIGARDADAICAVLARSPLAPQIHRLSFARSLLGDEGLAHLTALPHLSVLDVSRTRVTEAGVARARTHVATVIAHALGRPAVFQEPD